MTAQIILGALDLDAEIDFFAALGFSLDAIHPADSPRVAELSGDELRLRIDVEATTATRLRLQRDDTPPGELVSPYGTCIEIVGSDAAIASPRVEPSLTLSRLADADWGIGRAGMRYRDLVPDRQGGALIASHIHIPDAGPVPDYVHYHEIRFQIIYCWRGWVRLVYEDQGEPFVLAAGGCVLQPPLIRHRVLESSGDLEVIEVGSPAEHVTRTDREIALPTATIDPDRNFSGQRFVHHVAADAAWSPTDHGDVRSTGIGTATGGVGDVRVIRPRPRSTPTTESFAVDLSVVLQGSVDTDVDRTELHLDVGDAITIPPGMPHRITGAADGTELLNVRVF